MKSQGLHVISSDSPIPHSKRDELIKFKIPTFFSSLTFKLFKLKSI